MHIIFNDDHCSRSGMTNRLVFNNGLQQRNCGSVSRAGVFSVVRKAITVEGFVAQY